MKHRNFKLGHMHEEKKSTQKHKAYYMLDSNELNGTNIYNRRTQTQAKVSRMCVFSMFRDDWLCMKRTNI